ncbi:50S ribosomal protein L6 [Gracilariopsis chorda]|uniref:50S ribosomal protein L6 n=1 Tax=Gracilariopsis chorda TaxID=448386 RepID=A0A2V3IEE0_9FLOR|nr:50S ribosomal protein L6 [Gracilariopsis chorda]|eukprot:PXF40456.1 50S ribosomal protein L6 [Gracilariopsis chorda]
MAARMLPIISLKQFYKYLGRYVRASPFATRITAPTKQLRVPTEPGVALFFYPPDSCQKTTAFAAGPLGHTASTIHPANFQIVRSVALPEEQLIPRINYWGVGNALSVTKNLASGVTDGFAVNLELHGVGYRAEALPERNQLLLRLGLSHVIELPLHHPHVFINVISPQLVQVAGINRPKVHQLAATIRSYRPPEPYKGKGIRYKSEPVRRKRARKD